MSDTYPNGAEWLRHLHEVWDREARRDAWARREGLTRSRGWHHLYRLLGLRRYRLPDLPGFDPYFHRDHMSVWIKDGRAACATAHIYGFNAEHRARLEEACRRSGLVVEVIPPADGWYGHGTTMLVYRRAPVAPTAVDARGAPGCSREGGPSAPTPAPARGT